MPDDWDARRAGGSSNTHDTPDPREPVARHFQFGSADRPSVVGCPRLQQADGFLAGARGRPGHRDLRAGWGSGQLPQRDPAGWHRH
ncbi:MAG: hypothetical protein ACK56I_01550, partial [bacterium]